LPVAAAESPGLKRVQDSQHLVRIAADRDFRDIDETDHSLGIDEEGRALGDAEVSIENAELFGEVALEVRDHGEGQVFEAGMVVSPGKVDILGIVAAAEDLGIARGEVRMEFAEADDFGGADAGKVERPEEVDLPLTGIGDIGDGFEFLARFETHYGRKRERGKFLSDS